MLANVREAFSDIELLFCDLTKEVDFAQEVILLVVTGRATTVHLQTICGLVEFKPLREV